MKTYLVDNKFRYPGLALFLVGSLLAILAIHFDLSPNFLEIVNPLASDDDGFFSREKKLNLLDEIGALMVIIGLLMLGFSKEKTEDEFFQNLRLLSLQYSIVIYALVLILAVIFVHGADFLWVMTYCMILPLLLFVLRYYFLRWQNQKELSHEE